jgi:hypothetical protein
MPRHIGHPRLEGEYRNHDFNRNEIRLDRHFSGPDRQDLEQHDNLFRFARVLPPRRSLLVRGLRRLG